MKPDEGVRTFQIGRTYIQGRIKKLNCMDKLLKCCLQKSITHGKDFRKFPEDFPSELQKVYFSRETRLNKVLEDTLFENNSHASFDQIRNSFLLPNNQSLEIEKGDTLVVRDVS